MKNKFDEVIAFLGGKKVFGIVAGIVAGLYLIAGITVTIMNLLGYSSGILDKKISTPTMTAAATATPTPEPTPTPKPTETTVGTKESVTAGEFTYSVKSYDLDYTDTGLDSLFRDKPDGYKYIKVDFYFTNNSKTTHYISMYDFDCYADNAECDREYSLSDSSKSADEGRAVLISGVWLVPKDAKSIEIEYESYSDDKIIFKIK